jgi:hypothetical protein
MNHSFLATILNPETELDFLAEVIYQDSETLIIESVWDVTNQSDVRITPELTLIIEDAFLEHLKSENHARNYARGEDMAFAKARGDFY